MLVQGLVVERGVEEQSIQAGVVAVLLELAKQLIGSFFTRCCSAGRPRSVEHLQLDRLNVNLSHWPKHADRKGNCAVSYQKKNKLTAVGNHHESRVQCEYCKVYLCVSSGINCFKKYHTLVDFTS